MTPAKKYFDFEGSTVEDAIKKAIKVTGVSREKMMIKIVCEEQRGLFGMEGASPAKIKVHLKEN